MPFSTEVTEVSEVCTYPTKLLGETNKTKARSVAGLIPIYFFIKKNFKSKWSIHSSLWAYSALQGISAKNSKYLSANSSQICPWDIINFEECNVHVTNGTNRGDVCFCFCFLDITKALMNLKWLIWAHLVTITIILLLIAFVSLGLILMLSKRHRKTARHGRHSCPVRVCDKGKVILFSGDHSPRMKKKTLFLYIVAMKIIIKVSFQVRLASFGFSCRNNSLFDKYLFFM